MRIAVVGATGNVGTAVLRALRRRPEVTEIRGIARRLPDPSAEPYDAAHWEAIDIGAASAPERAVEQLVRAFDSIDTVVHLAWLLQPNSRRDLLRRVNVEGTRNVARAARLAGVGHLIAASSVGAYAPVPAGDDDLRDETWPALGIRTSHYSVDKAAQEDVLDEVASAHPELVVSRLRPALIFQDDAASSIQRYFLGSHIPVQALRWGGPPLLPLPAGLRFQAVHAADVAEAYAEVAVRRAPGAFNICAPEVLRADDLVGLLGARGSVPVPTGVLRAALAAAHRAGAIAADEGWLDMAMSAPLMDASRAREVLGWRARHTAADALGELLVGMVEGHGAASSPLRPRAAGALALVPGRAAVAEVAREQAGSADTAPIDRHLLALYLADHLSGASAGLARAERMRDDFADTSFFPELAEVAERLRAEHRFVRDLIRLLALPPMRYRQAVTWCGERIGRLKTNGRPRERSPMTPLLELELLRGAVLAKLGLWETLRAHAAGLGVDPEVLSDLEGSAHHQLRVLGDVHGQVAPRALRVDRSPFDRVGTPDRSAGSTASAGSRGPDGSSVSGGSAH
ncbi:NAD-dependent epimerase/dehydratase family protein [Brachybacterium sp. ACRRE]|uniref:NAD-dependent epimerase/dehydratase family protein n=1 Tax=unclassified Brachybacterium TaxID=2623841 RepID=UPI001EF26B87|nr:NAD-dependent epimerase/dehydratase family protein [Brachybacterium sp. ACRRE]MCG7309429.1 NAD-dependent epimerase/dehydratase family protein [Brachybacterium sp. ACRRE]